MALAWDKVGMTWELIEMPELEKVENKEIHFKFGIAVKTNAVDVGGFLLFTAQWDSMLGKNKEFTCLKQPILQKNCSYLTPTVLL